MTRIQDTCICNAHVVASSVRQVTMAIRQRLIKADDMSKLCHIVSKRVT